MDRELAEYRKLIGREEYKKQYTFLYHEALSKKSRFSKKDYENSPEKLKQIKEKYKNGISKEIINEMLGIKEIKEKCQFCENCDLDGHCIAKENYDFFECENDEYFEPIEEENK